MLERKPPISKQLNYNLLAEEIIVDLGHIKMAYPMQDLEEVITIEGIKFVAREGVIYEIICEGPISLLVHRKQEIRKLGQNTCLGRSIMIDSKELPPDKQQYYELVLPGTFDIRDFNSYLLQIGEDLKHITRLKDFNSLFPTLKSELKTFTKKERIKMKREPDLIKVVRYCQKRIFE